jgi:hypothetical protein
MAAQKTLLNIAMIGEGSSFKLERVTPNGAIQEAQVFEAEKLMKPEAVATALGVEVKSQTNRRTMWQSLLGIVFADPLLDGYKGKGDKVTGKVAKEAKNSIRTAEEKVLRAMVDKGHIKLHVNKDDNAEKIFQRFCTDVREDKNYSNMKARVTKYFCVVGSSPVTKNGYLVPSAIMDAEIQKLLSATPAPKTTLADRINEIAADFGKETNPDLKTVLEAAQAAKMLYSTLEGTLTHMQDLLAHTAAAGGANVEDASQKAIESAKKTLESSKTKRVPADQT